MARSQDDHTELIQKLTAQLKQARIERDALLEVCKEWLALWELGEITPHYASDVPIEQTVEKTEAAIKLCDKGE